MRFLWNNYIVDSTLTESSSISGYPVTNVQLSELPRVFQLDGNSGNVVIDLGSELNITAIVIGNTNMTSSGTLTIEANSSDSWGSPPVQESITVDDSTTNQILFLDETYRYFRIVFSDATLTDIQVGHIFIGTYLQINSWQMVDKGYKNTSTFNVSDTRSLYGNKGINFKEWNVNFPGFTDVELNNFNTMSEDNQGVEPVWVVFYEDSLTTFPPYFCRLALNDIIVQEAYIANDNTFPLLIQEVN